LFRINQRTFPADKYRKILDDEQADPQADFNSDMMDIIPTANAEMSSKMHRIQTSQLEMETMPMVLQAGGNPAPILKNFFDAIGSELIDQIFPEDGNMSPEDKKMQEQMLKAQEQANKIAELQLQILTREQDRLDLDTREKVKKIQAEIEKIGVDMLETLANTMLKGEQAETESLKNGITLYVEHLRTSAKAVGALGDTNARPLALPQLPQANNNQRAL